MEIRAMTIGMFLLWGLLLLCAVLIVHMLVSLVRAGDERRQMIVGKACTTAFCATVGCLLLETALFLLAEPELLLSPFLTLGIAAVAVTVALAVYKRKYGD